jgi:ribosomal protein S18 acetylase RimI-like enzyme
MSQDDTGDLRKNGHITIREMEIGDLAPVYYLGERLFTRSSFPVLYRTWDSFEVTNYYNSDPEYCLVAEDKMGVVIGFALGTTVEKDHSAWKYGYLAWLGVDPEYQGKHVADRLLKEFEKRVKEDGARILLVDTEAENHRAIQFFSRNGFAQPKSHVWLSKSLTRNQQNGAKPLAGYSTRAQKKAKSQKKSTPGPVLIAGIEATTLTKD